MESKNHRLDRLISQKTEFKRKEVRLLVAQRRILINGVGADSVNQVVGEFDRIECDGVILQNNQAKYVMLHKPTGVVSATKDDIHPTVMDLIADHIECDDLHIVGRLDLNTSGLVLLTNDGAWSRQLTAPESKVPKVYQVELANELSEDYIDAFAQGMHFPFEDIITQPAKLKILSPHVAEVTLMEGKYHQIKRMFGRFRNPVMKLHRSQIGNLKLDASLREGQCRVLNEEELQALS